jgi:hypothetical protein
MNPRWEPRGGASEALYALYYPTSPEERGSAFGWLASDPEAEPHLLLVLSFLDRFTDEDRFWVTLGAIWAFPRRPRPLKLYPFLLSVASAPFESSRGLLPFATVQEACWHALSVARQPWIEELPLEAAKRTLPALQQNLHLAHAWMISPRADAFEFAKEILPSLQEPARSMLGAAIAPSLASTGWIYDYRGEWRVEILHALARTEPVRATHALLDMAFESAPREAQNAFLRASFVFEQHITEDFMRPHFERAQGLLSLSAFAAPDLQSLIRRYRLTQS